MLDKTALRSDKSNSLYSASWAKLIYLQTGGREGLQTIERVRSVMQRERLRVPTEEISRQVVGRIVRDEPGRSKSRGATVLRPVFNTEDASVEFDIQPETAEAA